MESTYTINKSKAEKLKSMLDRILGKDYEEKLYESLDELYGMEYVKFYNESVKTISSAIKLNAELENAGSQSTGSGVIINVVPGGENLMDMLEDSKKLQLERMDEVNAPRKISNTIVDDLEESEEAEDQT